MSPGERASAVIVEHKEALARGITDALYAEMPWLYDKYGERGRLKCLQDMRYNLEHLAPAAGLDDPSMFARYAAWCDDVLRARGIPTGELARSLELMAAALRERLDPEAADAATRCVQAGVRALQPGAPS
ncbi:MAG TPA: hypothetical protein VNP72_09720 [Longimicrobium sp.]|nr:hypothetical protein [Longimicrobium sp.]